MRNTWNTITVCFAIFALASLTSGCTLVQPSEAAQQPTADKTGQANTASPDVTEYPAAITPVLENPPADANSPVTPSDPTQPGITLAELARHGDENDCWVGFGGNVYDITDFIWQHPGGSVGLIKLCGKAEEFERAFTGKHGESKISVLQKNAKIMGSLA